jgi:hypothetical protein
VQSVCACDVGWLCVCGACLRLWCRVAVCSLRYNSIGDEGAAAISRGLASVPQLQTLKYVFVVCVSWWCRCSRGTLWRRACGAGCECACRVCGRATWGGCVCAARHEGLLRGAGVVMCSLFNNRIGPEGAAAISRGLPSVPSVPSVPQLQMLQYVFVVCVLVVPLRPRDPVAQSVRGWVRVCVQSVCACDVGWLCVCGATCVRACACGVVCPCAAWAGTVQGPRVRRPSAAAWPVCPSCKC